MYGSKYVTGYQRQHVGLSIADPEVLRVAYWTDVW